MANRQSFGRRDITKQQPSLPFGAPRDHAGLPSVPVARKAPRSDAVDDELREWKRTRKFTVPWRPLSLMASLCFGIASFVLPASVNDAVQWLLWGLTAASLYAGFRKRTSSKV